MLIPEIIINLIQPYPGVQGNIKAVTLGYEREFSINGILLALSFLRLYILIKVIKHLNNYTSQSSERIYKFFQNRFVNVFLYKANLKKQGFYYIAFFCGFIILLFAMIFRIFEDSEPYLDSDFATILNCLWFLMETITTSN
jgi:hypothetical protein